MEGVESSVWVDTPVFEELRLADRGLNRRVGDSGTAGCRGRPWLM